MCADEPLAPRCKSLCNQITISSPCVRTQHMTTSSDGANFHKTPYDGKVPLALLNITHQVLHVLV